MSKTSKSLRAPAPLREPDCKPALTPKLRFPEFRGAPGWNLVTLQEASVPVAERVGPRKLTPVSISAGIGFKHGYSNGFFQNCFEQNQHGKQLKKHITSGARSNGLVNISKETFFGVEIPTPTPPEQQKIAECLSSVDDLIAAQTQKHEALKTHKEGLMQQLFPSPEEVEA